MSKTIRRERAKIQSKLEDWEIKLFNLQASCPHTNKSRKHMSNLGNYDPSADSYWTEFHCLDCGKRWDESGSV